MKPIFDYSQNKTKKEPLCFHSCLSSQVPPKTTVFAKKNQKFITLSKNIPTSREQPQKIPALPPQQVYEFSYFTPKKEQPPQQYQFQQTKTDFLQQIRKYNPNTSIQKQPEQEQHTLTLDSSKERNSSGKSNQNNNLSLLLESLNNEMFSSMFVSESVKEKIVVSASLGSISQVKSDLEVSQKQSESYMNSLVNTERSKRGK